MRKYAHVPFLFCFFSYVLPQHTYLQTFDSDTKRGNSAHLKIIMVTTYAYYWYYWSEVQRVKLCLLYKFSASLSIKFEHYISGKLHL